MGPAPIRIQLPRIRHNRTSTAWLVGLLVWVAGGQAHAISDPTPGGVDANTVKLPTGPGSLEGLGQAGEVSVFSGQYGYSIPLDLPKGQAGFGPSLSLSYSGDTGNGTIGIGWGFSPPHIKRSTRQGVPAFNDTDELEIVGLGGGRLVPVHAGTYAGEWRVEGSGQTIRVQKDSEEDAFIATTSDGTLWRFDVRVTRSDGIALAWYVSRVTALGGRHLDFSYTDSADPLASPGHALLTKLSWGPSLGAAVAFEARFVYAEREDRVESFRAGLRQVLRHRLHRVEIDAFGARRKTYTLAYSDWPLSRLSSVAITGAEPAEEALPILRFEYGDATAPPALLAAAGVDGWRLDQRGVTLQDVDLDGLVDLVRFEEGARSYKRNRGGTFDRPRQMVGAAERDLQDSRLMDLDGNLVPELVYVVNDTWRVYDLNLGAVGEPLSWVGRGAWPGTFGVGLAERGQHFVDVDGDGRVDVLSGTQSALVIRRSEDAGVREPVRVPPLSTDDGFLDPQDVEFHDINGDGLADAVWLADAWIKIYLGRGDGTFETRAVRYCYPWNAHVVTGPSRAAGACDFARADAVDFSNVRLVDLDRDGMLDLVRVSGGHVYWWPGYWFADAEDKSLPFGDSRRLERPPGSRFDDVVTTADLNGNGSVDVVWSSASGLYIMDLAGAATRGMLVAIDNGVGLRTEIAYTTTALLQLAAAEDGSPWSAPFPSNMTVPFEVTTRVPEDPDHPVIVHRSVVRDGFWDTEERRFGGFLEATQLTVADPDRPSEALVVTTEFERGEGEQRVLRGRPVRVSRADQSPSGPNVFDVVDTSNDALEVSGLEGAGPLLRVPVTTEVVTRVYEKTCEPRFTRTTFEYDAHGQVTRESKFGEVDADGEDIEGDESIVETDYVSDFDAWILFRPCRATTKAADGSVLDRTVSVYATSGTPSASDPVCVGGANDGRVRATWSWLGPIGGSSARVIKRTETEYDSVGNVVNVTADGVEHAIAYDANAMYPLSETLPGAPYAYAWSHQWTIDEWDETLGVPLRLRGPDDRETAIEVDSLGRTTGVFGDAVPGGALERLSTTSYSLAESAPFPRVTTVVHEGGAIPDVTTVNVATAGGKPLYSATAEDSESWIIDGHRKRNRLGLTTERARPYRASSLPTSMGEGLVVETIAYDAQGRPVSQLLPAFPRAAALTGLPSIPATAPILERVAKSMAFAPFRTTMSSTDQADVVSELDGLGRTVSMARTVPGVGVERMATEYDAAGRVVSVVVDDAGTSGTPILQAFDYDTLGRLLEASDPDAGTRYHTWTDEGRLAASENALGERVEYAYDAIGRLTGRSSITGGGTETWGFDYDIDSFVGGPWDQGPENWGRLVRTWGPDGDSFVAYDSLGRPSYLERSITAHDSTVSSVATATELSWSGKALAQRVSRSGLERIRLEQDFDAAGRLRWIGAALEGASSPSLLWEAVSLLPSGAATLEHAGNGTGTVFERDALDQVSAMSVRDLDSVSEAWDRVTHEVDGGASADLETAFAGASSADIRYELSEILRNGYGAIRVVSDSASAPGVRSRDAVFEYDLAARLTYAEVAGHEFTYAYDARQNLTMRSMTVPFGAAVPDLLAGTYVNGGTGYGPRQLASVGTTTFSYDAAGRMTRVGPGGGLDTTMAFDAFDRVRVVDEPGSGQTMHRYDAGGERATTTWADGRIERYFGGGLTERDGRLELHVGLGGARQVARINVPAVSGGSLGGVPAVLYLHQGVGHGPSVVTDGDGELVEERHFEPYGVPLWGDEDYELERLGWNAKPVDPSTGWSDHGARWHGTSFARWLSVDPPLKGPEGWAKQGLGATPYGFVAGNPVLLWDPDGNCWFIDPVGCARVVVDKVKEHGFFGALAEELKELPRVLAEGLFIKPLHFYLGGGVAHAPPVGHEATARSPTTGEWLLGMGIGAAIGGLAGGALGRAGGREAAVAGRAEASVARSEAALAERSLQAEAVAARDALAKEVAKKSHPPATVVGAYSPSSGRVTAGASRNATHLALVSALGARFPRLRGKLLSLILT